MSDSSPTAVPAPPRRTRRGGEAFVCWTLRGALAVLVAWSACLWVLAGRGFGCCWAGLVEAAATELAAVAVALALPNYVVRVVFHLAMRIRPGDALAAQVLLAGRSRSSSASRARRLLWLMSIALAASAGGGLLTTAATRLAPSALRWLAGTFLYPAWMWSVTRLVVQVGLFLPMAVAIAAVGLIGSLLRRYGPSDPYRHLTRDAMWSSAAGLAAAAGLFWAGANLEAMAFGFAAALVGMSAATAFKRNFAAKAVRLAGPAAPTTHRWRQRWLNLGVFAALAWLVTAQCRALRDGSGCDWAAAWMWAAATAGVAAVVTRRLNRRVVVGKAVEARAAMAGAVVVAAGQVALLGLAATAGPARWVWILLAAAGQGPFAALAATALARRRRRFARTGYPGRFWLADAALGAAVGAAAVTLTLALPNGLLAAAIATLAGLMAVFVTGTGPPAEGRARTGRSGSLRRQFGWAATGAAAILAVAMTWAGLVRSVRRGPRRRVVAGASITAYQAGDRAVAALPVAPARPGKAALTELARKLIRSRQGRWWVISAGDADLLTGLGEGVRASVYLPDEAIGRLPMWAPGRRAREFGRYLNIHVRDLDGVYLSGLSADHADAWCLYNAEALSACDGRIAPGGLLVLRVAGSEDRLADVLAVAKTFDWVAPGGLAGVVVDEARVEMLLVARRGGPDAPAGVDGLAGDAENGVKVISVADLVAIDSRLRPVTILAPGRRGRSELQLSALACWLGARGN